MIRFTAISTLAYCESVSISAFNDGPIVVIRTRIVVIVVGRVSLGVLGSAGRRFCCCRLLRTDDRGGNPVSERMKPIICECCVVYGTVTEREVVVVVDESGVGFLAGRSELVIQRRSSLYIGGSPCRWDDAAELQ